MLEAENQEFTQIITRLKNYDSTEDLLVALTLLPKVTKTDFEFQRAFEAIPWKKVHEMMITSDLEMVGVLIWNQFSSKFPANSRILKRLEPACQLLTGSNDDLKQMVIETVMTILDKNELGVLSNLALQNILKGNGFESRKSELIQLVIGKDLSGTYLDLVFDYLVSNTITEFDDPLRLLSILVFQLDLNGLQVNILKSVFKRLLKTKLGPENMDRILCTCGKLSSREQFCGPTTGSDNELSEGQFWTMLVHLAGCEIRLILDTTTKNTQEYKISITMYYLLLENILTNIVEEVIELNIEELESVRKSMAETYYIVLEFLLERWDQYLESNNLNFLDNELVVFSLQSYCHYIGEESMVGEELVRLVPFIVTVLQTEFSCTPFDIYSLMEMLTLITSESITLEIFVEHGGDIIIVENFVRNSKKRALVLDSALLNIIATKGSNGDFILSRFKHYEKLLPLLKDFISNGELQESFNALICYLLLFRSNIKYQSLGLPMDDIILVLKKRYHSDFPEYLVDFFDLCLLTLSDCLPKNLDPKIKQKLLNQVKEMESNAHGNEVESLQQLLNKLSL